MSENIVKRPPIRATVLMVLHAVSGGIILWMLLKLVPQYLKIFKEFGARLPDTTIMFIEWSQWTCRYGYILLLLVPALGAGDFAIMQLLNRAGRTRLMTARGVLAWLAEMLLIGLIVMSLALPMNALVTRLSE